MSGEFLVRPAGAGDVAAVLGLRVEAEEWLRARGIAQWTPDYDDYARQVLRAAVDAGTAWVVDDLGVVATVSLNGPDLDFWDPVDGPDTGLYLGKMIVARSHAGRDIGAALMNWASLRAAAAGKVWLRLDCRRDNTRLHSYYEERGFTHVRTVVPAGRRTMSGALFQRPAGAVMPAKSVVAEAGR